MIYVKESPDRGHYDLRRGVSSYAPIVGAFGALAVPAIVILFNLRQAPVPRIASLITFAAGLLIVAIIASLIGSIGLAAIGAETRSTANIPASVMLVGVSVAVAVVNILAAFEVLAEIYISHPTGLFAFIVFVGGAIFVFFLAFAIGGSWHTGPTGPGREIWLSDQWIQSHRQAQKLADLCGFAGFVPMALAMVLRWCGVMAWPTGASINIIAGA